MIASADTGGSRYYPIVSGTGAPEATITLTAAGQSYSTTVDASGTWTSSALAGLGVGVTSVTVTQRLDDLTSPPSTTSVDLAVVSVQAFGPPSGGAQQLAVAGVANSTVRLQAAGTSVTVRLDSSGSGTATLPATATQIIAFYSDDGRQGPASTVQLN